MWETWVRSLGSEDPLEKGKAAHGEFHGMVHGVAKSRTRLSDFHFAQGGMHEIGGSHSKIQISQWERTYTAFSPNLLAVPS